MCVSTGSTWTVVLRHEWCDLQEYNCLLRFCFFLCQYLVSSTGVGWALMCTGDRFCFPFIFPSHLVRTADLVQTESGERKYYFLCVYVLAVE